MADFFGEREIKVMGQVVSLNVREGLPITDVSRDMDQVAARMGWWASVWASAEEERIQADAHYRRWRAAKTMEVLEAEPKLPEYKVTARVNADPQFLKFKDALAAAERNVTLAKGIFQAFDKKANQLQSRGAMARSEIGATGMTTPERPKSAPKRSELKKDADEERAAARDDAVRKKLKGKKKARMTE